MRWITGGLLLLTLAGPAAACAVPQPFAVAHLASAPVVARVELIGWQFDPREGATLTLRPVERLKGDPGDEVHALWPILMAEQPPDRWTGPSGLIVALQPGPDGRFLLVVEMCGEAHLVEVRAALDR